MRFSSARGAFAGIGLGIVCFVVVAALGPSTNLVHVAISPMTYFLDRPRSRSRPRPRSFRKAFEDEDEAEHDGSARIGPSINGDRVPEFRRSSGDIYEQACQVGNGTIAGYTKHLFGVVGFDAPCD